MSFIGLIICAIIIGAVIAIALVAMRAYGFSPPTWVVQIFWIVVVAFVAILAIKFLLSIV